MRRRGDPPLRRSTITVDPAEAWALFGKDIVSRIVSPINPYSEKPKHHTRFVCISDTHSCHQRLEVPNGDILLHTGDFTRTGTPREVKEFADFVAGLPHRHKVVIAGNHDLTFHPESYKVNWKLHRHPYEYDTSALAAYLKQRCIYLEDELVTLRGFSIYGTPWQPRFGSWAFNLDRGSDLQAKWDLIPDCVDILLTHTPPFGHGDLCFHGLRAGCVNLLDTVEERVRPAVHVFGHIHEGYGLTTNNRTLFINASSCNLQYQPTNPPIVFDLPNKKLKDVVTVASDPDHQPAPFPPPLRDAAVALT
jgi:predicted phosphodiesterase